MITNIYFVRHSEPDYSIRDDEIRPLTKQGEIDSQRVADYFEDKDINLVMSSPFKRAVDTIKPFADKRGLPIELLSDFRERKIDSCWIEDFRAFSQRQWADFEYKLTDGESLSEVQNRNVGALKETIKANAGKNIVIGSHGTALSTIINFYDPSFGYNDFDRIRNVMPWIVKFSFEDNILQSIEKINILTS